LNRCIETILVLNFEKCNFMVEQGVATCPLQASEGEAHGCAFQRRKDARSRRQRLFVENVGKNRRKPVKMKIVSSGVVFTFEEGISTSHVCPKGQQPIFKNCGIVLP